jgi:hypothetical protein
VPVDDASLREGLDVPDRRVHSGALEARDRVREIEASDPSPGVREAAEDVLALL